MATCVNRIVTGEGFACNTFKSENMFDRYIYIYTARKVEQKKEDYTSQRQLDFLVTHNLQYIVDFFYWPTK